MQEKHLEAVVLTQSGLHSEFQASRGYKGKHFRSETGTEQLAGESRLLSEVALSGAGPLAHTGSLYNGRGEALISHWQKAVWVVSLGIN